MRLFEIPSESMYLSLLNDGVWINATGKWDYLEISLMEEETRKVLELVDTVVQSEKALYDYLHRFKERFSPTKFVWSAPSKLRSNMEFFDL